MPGGETANDYRHDDPIALLRSFPRAFSLSGFIFAHQGFSRYDNPPPPVVWRRHYPYYWLPRLRSQFDAFQESEVSRACSVCGSSRLQIGFRRGTPHRGVAVNSEYEPVDNEYEVEQKFPAVDLTALSERLSGLGATVGRPQLEVDLYFGHPARDFAQTDEALRIRRRGESVFVTYKGPKIDKTTKTRREIDLPLPPGEATAEACHGMLVALGFRPVGEVRKSRRKAHLDWEGRRVEVSLDEVEGLGTFAELELVVGADQLEPAKACIASLAKTLGLVDSERRSYLELLLQRG